MNSISGFLLGQCPVRTPVSTYMYASIRRGVGKLPLPRPFFGGRGADFTHPRVGQAEHLACRKRPPNAFLRAEARTHFPVGGHPTGLIDNNLITVVGYTGYP